MPSIVKEDHDNLNVSLIVNISTEDYEPKFKSELNKYRQQAHLKGFRKGKTPLSVIRKMYGKQALVDIINRIVQEELDKFLIAADFDILGNPLPSEAQEQYEFDTKDLVDFAFKFDLGLAPEFEIQGLEDTTFNYHDVSIPDSFVEETLAEAQKRLGKQVAVNDEIQNADIIRLQAEELDGDTIKENGWANEFSVSFSELTEDMQTAFTGKKKGDLVKFDIFNLSKGKEEAFVRKYFLDVNEDAEEKAVIGNDFQAVITEITRVKPAPLDQDFFDDYFGKENVTTIEAAKEKLSAHIKANYDQQADALLFKAIHTRLKEKNQPEFPEEFLKRWMKVNGNLPKEIAPEERMDSFKEGLTINLIKSKLMKKFEISIEEADIRQHIRAQVLSYFGGYDYGEVVDNTVNQMMENERQINNVYDEIAWNRIFEPLKEIITINKTPIAREEFEELLKKETEEDQTISEAVPPVETASTEAAIITEEES